MLEQLSVWEEEDEFKTVKKDIIGFFITVTPEHDDKNYLKLLNVLMNFTRKKGIKQSFATIEQSGETEETRGYHQHLHILVVLDKSVQQGEPGRMKKGILNTFSRLCKRDERYINIKAVTEKNFEARLKYINGMKSDKEKDAVLKQDKIWRESLGLCETITTG